MVEDKKVLLEKVDTVKNVADSLTKSVSTEKFSWCRGFLVFSVKGFQGKSMCLCVNDVL